MFENPKVSKGILFFAKVPIPSNASALARFQPSLVALHIFVTQIRQPKLPFLKFTADRNEALLLRFAKRLQARTFRRSLPVPANGCVQQYHNLYNFSFSMADACSLVVRFNLFRNVNPISQLLPRCELLHYSPRALK